MRSLRLAGAAFAAGATLLGGAEAQSCIVSDELLVLQVDLAQAQLGRYSDQLSLWTSIEGDLSPVSACDGFSGGCVGSGLTVQVDTSYAAALQDTDGDGTLSPDEIANDPEAAALSAAMQASVCESLQLADCSQVHITGINTGAPAVAGGSVSNSLNLGVTDTFHAHIMEADTDGDGTLSPAEMAAHPTVAAMVAAMQQSICDSIPACTDPNTIAIDSITSGAGGGRRLLKARGEEQVSLNLAQPTLQKFGAVSALIDCELSATEIAASPQATGFANALGRVNGQSVFGLRIPGCTSVRGQVGQVLESQRRVTMSPGHWDESKVEGSTHYTTLAADFTAAGCTEFALVEEQCELLEVRSLRPETLGDGSVAVMATLGMAHDQVLVLADVESPGR